MTVPSATSSKSMSCAFALIPEIASNRTPASRVHFPRAISWVSFILMRHLVWSDRLTLAVDAERPGILPCQVPPRNKAAAAHLLPDRRSEADRPAQAVIA